MALFRHVHAAVVCLGLGRWLLDDSVVDHAVVLASATMLLLHFQLITVQTQVTRQVRGNNLLITLRRWIIESMLFIGHRGATRQVLLACDTPKIVIGAVLHLNFILLLVLVFALNLFRVHGTFKILRHQLLILNYRVDIVLAVVVRVEP